MKKKKTVYLAMSADLIHVGHLNIINIASKYGEVIVGLLTDRAIASYKRVPIMEYKDRYKIISSIKGVNNVIPQKTHDYVSNLQKLKPDFVVHGDDWKIGVQKKIRERALKTIKKWGGKYTRIHGSKIEYYKDIHNEDEINAIFGSIQKRRASRGYILDS